MTQLAGRSGRDAPGRVIVQTYQPDARPIALAARHDVEEFLAGELERRRELGYPPFRHLVRRRLRPGARGPTRVLARASHRARQRSAGADCSARRRSCACAAVIARSSWSRRTAPPRRLDGGRLLAAAAPAMRRDGLAVSVDVDPQGVF